MEKLTEQELQQITGGVPSFITKGKEIINNPKSFWDNIKDSKFLEIGLKLIWRNWVEDIMGTNVIIVCFIAVVYLVHEIVQYYEQEKGKHD